MITKIKTLLGEAAANYTDELIDLCYDIAKTDIEAYCNRSLDAELELVAVRLAVIKLNRLNTEGLASQGFSGVSESYVDGFPADILAILKRKRKIKIV